MTAVLGTRGSAVLGPTMHLKDIYDDMPDGAAQRDRDKQRLAELEREGAARAVALLHRPDRLFAPRAGVPRWAGTRTKKAASGACRGRSGSDPRS